VLIRPIVKKKRDGGGDDRHAKTMMGIESVRASLNASRRS
jgi:hypothetical protein